jgi:hypothetical protein
MLWMPPHLQDCNQQLPSVMPTSNLIQLLLVPSSHHRQPPSLQHLGQRRQVAVTHRQAALLL